MISKETIDKIFSEAKIEEVVGDFLQLKRKGSDFWACCPFHNEKTPSFSVSPAKGIFKCFGCGEGGNPIDFVMKHEQLTYPEALKYLANKYNISIEETEQSSEQKELQTNRESLYIIHHLAKDFFKDQLLNTDEGKSVGLGYFKERGFSEEIILQFELGYSPDQWNAFSEYAHQKGYQKSFLLQSGLSKEKNGTIYDTFRGRVIFPIHNITGRVIGFGARILSAEKKAPKYINSTESDIYEKSKVLFGIFQAKKEIVHQQNCLLVEGYTDVISLFQAGLKNVVASSGTSLTKDQIRLIKRYTNNITILYDGDFAGIKASFRGIDMILEEGMSVKVVLFPEGEDPDSLSKKLPEIEFKHYITQNTIDFIEFKAKSLFEETKSDPFKKSSIIHDILNSIALIPDPITRSLYIKSCSKLIEMEERILIMELNKIVRKNVRDKYQEKDPEIVQNEIPVEKIHTEDPLWKNTEVNRSESFEKDILRLILNYGEKEITLSNENEMYHVSVYEFFKNELERDGLEFKNTALKNLYHYILPLFLEKKWSLDILYRNENEEIRGLAIELTLEKYSLSDWERKNIIVNTEEMLLKRAVLESLYAYKVYRIQEMIYEEEESLKLLDESQGNIMIGVLQKLILLKDIKRKLTLEIGRPI